MTGYTVHTGSTVKFSEGWDQIFAGTPKKPARSPVAEAKKHSSKKPARIKKQRKGRA
jgi:hypothetical protein